MEAHLKIEHLAAYLPYRLNLLVLKNYSIGDGFWISKGNETELDPLYLGTQLKYCKPILRPLSDLTKEIEHNGEKFVPMKSLFEETDMLEWLMVNDENYDAESYFKEDDDLFYYYIFIHYSVEYHFGYSICDQSFSFFDDFECHVVEKQLSLFNKLFEWHFDVYRLIEAGLAVDINKFAAKTY